MPKAKPYQEAYAKRHKYPIQWILNSPKLELAAVLEHQLKLGICTVMEARYSFIEIYPECNCIVAETSVLKLILPFKDSTYGWTKLSAQMKARIFPHSAYLT